MADTARRQAEEQEGLGWGEDDEGEGARDSFQGSSGTGFVGSVRKARFFSTFSNKNGTRQAPVQWFGRTGVLTKVVLVVSLLFGSAMTLSDRLNSVGLAFLLQHHACNALVSRLRCCSPDGCAGRASPSETSDRATAAFCGRVSSGLPAHGGHHWAVSVDPAHLNLVVSSSMQASGRPGAPGRTARMQHWRSCQRGLKGRRQAKGKRRRRRQQG